MALHLGYVSAPAANGNVTVTGIPFQPVAVVFWGVDNPLTNISQCFGATSGSGEEWAMWTGIRQETSGYTERHREMRDDHCFYMYSLTNHSVVQAAASMVGFTSDGFTLAFTGVGQLGRPIFYMAMGDNQITAAHAGTFLTGASTGTTAVTGTGFRPDALIVAHQLNGSLNAQAADAMWAIGFSDGTNQYSQHAYAQFAVATGGGHIHRTDGVASGFYTGLGSYVAALDSFDADGFTVDVTDAYVGSHQHLYLAIECAAAHVGSAEIPDSTGIVDYTTTGFEPGGVLFTWSGADTPSTTGATTMPVRPGVGGMDGVLISPTKPQHASITGLHRDNAPFGAYQPLQTWKDTAAVHVTGSGSQVSPGSSTDISIGQFSSFTTDKFSLNWTTTTTNSRVFGWLALPGRIRVLWIPHIYRMVIAGRSASNVLAADYLLLEGGDRIILEDGSGFLQL